MDITAIENQHIKIGKTSITVKNPDTGKTCGVVQHICKFMDLRPNRQIDYFKQIRKSGVWDSRIDGLMDCVIVVDNQLYYLLNLKPIEAYNQYFSDREGFENEKSHHQQLLQIAKNMKQFATVIPCYVD